MMNLIKERFIRVYGQKVWDDFVSFRGSDEENTTKSIDCFKQHLLDYANRLKPFDDETTYPRPVKNFYKRNSQFARFVLISIECVKVNNENPAKKGELSSNSFHLEHIVSQSHCDKNSWKNWIGNLSLISGELNTCSDYAQLRTPKEKWDYARDKVLPEKEMYINNFLINEIPDNGLSSAIIARGNNLQRDFQAIFSEKGIDEYLRNVLKYPG